MISYDKENADSLCNSNYALSSFDSQVWLICVLLTSIGRWRPTRWYGMVIQNECTHNKGPAKRNNYVALADAPTAP